MKYRLITLAIVIMTAAQLAAQTQTSDIALTANPTASSQNTSRGQTAAKAIDGIVSGYPTNTLAEWVAPGQRAGAWIRLTWATPITTSRIILHDRVNTADRVTSGNLRFSDGSSVPVGALANDGAGTTFTFTSRQVSWVQFDITGAAGENTGLAEFEVIGTSGTSTGGTPTPTPPPPPPPSPTGNVLFYDGWDNVVSPSGTCDFATVTDGRAWDDYGPSSTCVSPPVAQVVEGHATSGTRSLQVTFRPDGTNNGPDFRIVRDLPTRVTDMTLAWDQEWSANWVWASADHKMMIVGVDGVSQDVYFNIRGNGNGSSCGRVTVHVLPAGTAMSDPNVQICAGRRYHFEGHIVAGASGRVEVRVNGQPLTLRTEAGTQANPLALNTGSGFSMVKADTTYNVYSVPSSLGLTMYTWYDSVRWSAGGF